VAADFGDLKGVCQPGKSTSAPGQGVTAGEIKVGTFSDVGFTKNPELVDAAKVFTSWCNDAGGINGRKLVSTTRDAKLMEVRQRMVEACGQDFALVGGSAAFDGLGVKDRLSCLLPDFPSQATAIEANGADLQINQIGGAQYSRYAGYYTWLLKEAYPSSAKSVGIITGDIPITKVLSAQGKEAVTTLGGNVTYNDLYPAAGVSDWTPYAQTIKSKNVKGLLFYGSFTELAKLEQVLTGMNYKLDWIDANSNAYGPAFLKLAGSKSLSYQNNLADVSGVFPLEKASTNPASQQLLDLFKKYAPNANVTLPTIRAFSAWLVFAKSAASCGDALTRKCVFEAALKETAWAAGGLQAPVDLSKQDAPLKCFNIEKATPEGWQPADFKPDESAYRCNTAPLKLTGNYGKPMTLADVGKSLSDLK
jgi:ABC-type branched-subunit amino acid transport system substrate-binding protein